MESLSALCFAAALMMAFCALIGVSELNITLICTTMICLAGLLLLRRPPARQAQISPPQPLPPDPIHVSRAPCDRFGGMEPDLLQAGLVRKMMQMEEFSAQSKRQG